jgi:hypothetical protein
MVRHQSTPGPVSSSYRNISASSPTIDYEVIRDDFATGKEPSFSDGDTLFDYLPLNMLQSR